jgi:hypothetical protein
MPTQNVLYLVPSRGRWAAILLLAGISTLLRRPLLAGILASLRWLAIPALSGRRGTITLLRWVAILAWWRLAVALLAAVLAWRRLSVTSLAGWRASIALLRGTIAAGWAVRLLVLAVVRRVNGAEKQLDDPEIGGEIDWWVGAGHFFLLVLVV